MTTASTTPHIPVLLHEVVQYLAPRDGETYVDATFGAGGYSRAILEAADCRLLAVDRDPAVLPHAKALAQAFGERFTFLPGRFSELESLLNAAGVESIDGLVADLGVSSMQIDTSERGFSFRENGPLDMRMGGEGQTAADLINTLSEEALADTLYRYGGERKSRWVAKKIVTARETQVIETTGQLRDIIHSAIGQRQGDVDAATRSFQALRIAVNQELQEVEALLASATRTLKQGGRLVVVSFHSLEDRLVKHLIQGLPTLQSRYLPETQVKAALFTPLHKGVVTPSEAELSRNPRARSAKLRAAMFHSTPLTHH